MSDDFADEPFIDMSAYEVPVTDGYKNGIAVTNSIDVIREAEAQGFVAVRPGLNQLQLDIDDDAAYQTYVRNSGILRKYWLVKDVQERPSKSGQSGHRHITITLGRNVSDVERIALQAVLGSDLKREQFSLVRILEKDPLPTLFFEKDNGGWVAIRLGESSRLSGSPATKIFSFKNSNGHGSKNR